MNSKLEFIKQKINDFSRSKYLYALIIAVQFIPVYFTKNYNYNIINNFVMSSNIIQENLLPYFKVLYPIFKIIPIFLILLLILKKKVTKVYIVYVGICYILFGIIQNVGISDDFGIGIIFPNVIICGVLGILWLIEAFANNNEYMLEKKHPLWIYSLILLALFALWDPPVEHTIPIIALDWDPKYILFSFAGLTECMMTCVFITVFILFNKSYDNGIFRISCIVGMFRGIENMGLVILYFSIDRAASLAWLITHSPILICSIVGFTLSNKYEVKKLEVI